MKTKRQTKIAILAVGVLGLTLVALAAPQTKSLFTQTEVATFTDFGTALSDGKTFLLILGATGTGVTTDSSDPRALGASTITLSAVWDTKQVGPLWGSYHKVSADGSGTWDGYFEGINSLDKDGHVVLSEVNVAVGGGVYHGLVLRKTGTRVGTSGPIYWTGYIVEGGPGDLHFNVHGSRVDRIQVIPGMLLDPHTLKPTGELGMLARMDIVSGVGEDSHLGRITEQGVGLIDPVRGVSTMTGTAAAANQDLLHWVAFGTTDPATGLANVAVHTVGGTGLFDDATGAFSGAITEILTPTSDPMVFKGAYSYRATGTIRYSAPATIRKQ